MKRFAAFIILIALAGCAEIQMPSAKEIIKQPLGTTTLRRGMTKDEVIEKWGKPDSKKEYEKCDSIGIYKEEWVYNARISKSPLESNYFSNTMHLFFDGNNLTKWSQDE